jgi:CDK inhibitor PHO81
MTERTAYTGPFRDLENNLREAVVTSDIAVIKELLRYSDVLAQQNGGKSNVARILWKIIIEAPDELADLVLSSLATPFDYDFVDDINGRTCLHEAAIAGASRLVNICIQQGIQVDKIDIYGRSALHYACMNGHADICQMLLKRNVSPHSLDLDNCTPLVYATMRGNVDCVSALLDEGASMQAATPLNNLIPLSLASQSGHAAVVTLLLRHGAQSQPNTNGEYPMHLAAREGHAQICRLLVRQEGWDVPDKYHEWTPLFHAARHGRASCVEVLLEAGCRVDIADEHGRYAIHYAAWHGHHQCTDLLMKTAKPVLAETSIGHQLNLSPPLEVIKVPEPDGDCIPSLSLPPPIMPYRAYGHNYLDKVNLVQVAIGNSASRSEHCSRNHASGVRLQQRVLTSSSRDEYVLPSNSLKLVMTTGSDMNSAPYSMSLPQRDVDGVFSFQIVSLDALSLQFSIYPNFGTRTIGRAVALPSLFSSIGNSTPFVLPILDHRLQVIGEVKRYSVVYGQRALTV